MKNKSWLILFILVIPLLCLAEATIYEYKIHYAGLPVAHVTIRVESGDSTRIITLESTSKGLISALFPVENTYVSSCDDKYIPKHFWKTIYQQNVQEKKVIIFDQTDGKIVIRDTMVEKVYTLSCNTPIYDIVSMTFSLLQEVPKKATYTCYGNYRIWELAVEQEKIVELSFQRKKYPCCEYMITSAIEFDSKISSKTDILTNNIFKENGKTQYWITKDKPHLLLKAKYKRFPFSIYLYLSSIATQ